MAKDTFMVTFKIKENHHICDVFEDIESAFEKTAMKYAYHEAYIDKCSGSILFTLRSSDAYSVLLESLQKQKNIESFRIFVFKDLLNGNEVKAKDSRG
ncbi:MAG: hypothetical protein K2N54_06210 [Helicobacter sp.]|nr:hypothetical protein [Helicobacter sp.]